MRFRGLVQHHLAMALLVLPHMAPVGLPPLTVCSLPEQTLHVPSSSDFPGPQLHLWIHPHRFMHCLLMGSLPGLPSHALKSGYQSPWPHNSYSLHANETSTTWKITRSAISTSSHQFSLIHSCDSLCFLEEWASDESHGSSSLEDPPSARMPGTLISNENFTFLHPWACSGWNLADFWDDLKATFFLSQNKLLASF